MTCNKCPRHIVVHGQNLTTIGRTVLWSLLYVFVMCSYKCMHNSCRHAFVVCAYGYKCNFSTVVVQCVCGLSQIMLAVCCKNGSTLIRQRNEEKVLCLCGFVCLCPCCPGVQVLMSADVSNCCPPEEGLVWG